MEKLIIGTRGSKLALWQANWVKDRIGEAHPGTEVLVSIIKTEGDARHDLSPGAFGREGIFTAELDRALLDKRIDMAVHSLKDLPTKLGEGLALAAVSKRAETADLLILRSDVADKHGIAGAATAEEALQDLDGHITVGTSSLRRIALLKNRFPQLEFAPMRGNLDTRVKKLTEKEFDAIVVAKAGLDRLGVDTGAHLLMPLLPDWYLPAAGQGALAVETRSEGPAREAAKAIDHEETRLAVTAERTAMSALGAGCRVPAGFLGLVSGGGIRLLGVVGHPRGEPVIRAEESGPADRAEEVGLALAKKLLSMGADKVLSEVRE